MNFLALCDQNTDSRVVSIIRKSWKVWELNILTYETGRAINSLITRCVGHLTFHDLLMIGSCQGHGGSHPKVGRLVELAHGVSFA